MELKTQNIMTNAEANNKFSKILGVETPVADEALFAAASNPEYLHNLMSSRNHLEFLRHLLENPVYSDDVSLEDIDVKSFVDELQKSLFHQEKKEAFDRLYGNYFKVNEEKNAKGKSCKPCSDIKVRDFTEVYLDHNATTYVRPEVNRVLVEYYSENLSFSNPSSNTVQGGFTTDLLRFSRKKIADCISVKPDEIFFTGSGTEANNLAIKGIAFGKLDTKGHIITINVEHSSVLETMKYLEALGFSVTYLEADKVGRVYPHQVKQALRPDTILVSIIAANNEIGTINPIAEIGQICKEKNVPFMTDAIQAFGKMPLKPKEMGISLFTFSGHKIYAPKGVGGLYVEKGLTLVPLIHGGGQESGLRSGTENVAAILAMGTASELAHAEMEKETVRQMELRKIFLEGLREIEPGYILNGCMEKRLPNNLSIGFPGVSSCSLLGSLNRVGISVSAGSACNSKKMKNSHVMEAIGLNTENYGILRISFGIRTTHQDIEYTLKYLKEILMHLKA